MSEELTGADVAAVFHRYAKTVAELKDLLTELDTAVGDGDHGTNLDRGMRAAVEALDAGTPGTPGAVFNLVGRRLVSTVGGASGALYGTAFLRAAGAAGDATGLDASRMAAVLRQATDGIAARGKCAAGDKTMYDVWSAATEAVESAAAGGTGLAAALSAGAVAAAETVRRMVPWQARRGRASYLGERSVGHRDPGAVSSQALFECLAAQAAA
ncbi:dihydroxyacetone kinase subunit DhaL [Actinocatenispora rupis]|uniref:Dihydroxyacetone kinase subunit L n=1 Tax=Actinocatenispora rupis TaxID=519421 RepID=A0A8J3J5U1_9ACTN|nr:dihydroxyacetone kinase subunit DhaL [Actinocatenispora rupis]GID12497.1 dihydroxyacetone kinase subunit L [Actinocatenispora rupis]